MMDIIILCHILNVMVCLRRCNKLLLYDVLCYQTKQKSTSAHSTNLLHWSDDWSRSSRYNHYGSLIPRVQLYSTLNQTDRFNTIEETFTIISLCMKFNHLTPKQGPSYVHGDEDDFLRKISIRCTWVVSMGYVTIVSKIKIMYTVHLLHFVSCTTYQIDERFLRLVDLKVV